MCNDPKTIFAHVLAFMRLAHITPLMTRLESAVLYNTIVIKHTFWLQSEMHDSATMYIINSINCL